MVESAIHYFVLAVLLPAWLCVGLLDWYCHRKTRIEDTAGPRESLCHLLLSGAGAAAALPALLLEINALVLAIMAAAFVAHEAITYIDLRIAYPVRVIAPFEQRVHDFLTAIPFSALCLVAATHVPQALALFGLGDAPANWSVRLKNPPLPLAYLVAWFAACLGLNIIPFAEELLRCLRAQARRSA